MQSILLNSGKSAVARAIAEGRKLRVASFRIGQAANFSPVINGTNPLPLVVYTGGADAVTSSLINGDEVRYRITLIEPIGPFNVGNIMLYLEDDRQPGVPIPFIHGVLPAPVPKYKQDSTISIGNRIDINLIAKYVNVSEAFTLNVTVSTLSSLPNYRNELDLPAASLAVHQQVILQNTLATGIPSLIARREVDDSYFSMPFFQRLEDPNFGAIIGGNTGDKYSAFLGGYSGGGRFNTPSIEFINNIDGGDTWAVPSVNDIVVDGGTF